MTLTSAAPVAPVDQEPMPLVSSGPCWVCGAPARRRVWSEPFDLSAHPRFGPHAHPHHSPSHLVECRRCGFAQPESLPGRDDYFDLLYSDQPWFTAESMEAEFAAGQRDYIYREVLKALERRWRPGVPRTILDVGTNLGRFPHVARESGWEVEGCELNTRAAEFAARRTGLPIHQVRAQDLAAQGRQFGAVVLADVLEHIPRPAPLVAALRTLLPPGGLLAIKVPHGPAQRFKEKLRALVHRTPEAREAHRVGLMTRFVHVNLFSVQSLRLCLESAGFSDVRITVGAPEFSPTAPARQSALRIALYRTAQIVPGGVRSPLGFNLLAVGRNG